MDEDACRDAAGSVDEALSQDELGFEGIATHGYERSEVPAVRETGPFPLPAEVAAPAAAGVHVARGLLPTIHRLWEARGPRLLLWNYAPAPMLRDPATLGYGSVGDVVLVDAEHDVVACGVAKPRSFVDDAGLYLVVSTTVDVTLYAFHERSGGGYWPPERTDYRIGNDNVQMLVICSTPSGRIFMGGEDGGVYEFAYEPLSSWRKKCRKATVTRSWVPSIVQKLVGSLLGASGPVVDMCVDKSDRLYVLRAPSSISVFLVKEGESAWSMCELSDSVLSDEVFRASDRRRDRAPVELVRIFPESEPHLLVAVARSGERVFIRGLGKAPEIRSMQVASVRIPDMGVVSAVTGSVDFTVRDAVSSNGLMLLAVESSAGSLVVAVRPDPRFTARRQRQHGTTALFETFEVHACAGVELVAEIPMEAYTPQAAVDLYMAGSGAVRPVAELSALAQPHSYPARFAAVSFGTNGAVRPWVAVHPVDELIELVRQQALPPLRDFFAQYTPEQACAMCLEVLVADAGQTSSGPTSAAPVEHWLEPMDSSRMASVGADVVVSAAQLLVTPQVAAYVGSLDEVRTDTQLRPGAAALGGLGVASANSTLGYALHSQVRVTARRRGLALYVSRVLRPVWLSPVLSVEPESGTTGKRTRDGNKVPAAGGRVLVRSVLTVHQLWYLRRQLAAVRGALSKYPLGSVERGPDDQFHLGLVCLLSVALEAVDFLGSTRHHEPRAVDPDGLGDVTALTLRSLCVSSDARNVLRRLSRLGVVDASVLHGTCPLLFTKADSEMQQAYELLQRGAAGERPEENATQACHLLSAHLKGVDLSEAVARLRALGAWRAVVDLCAGQAQLAPETARDNTERVLELLRHAYEIAVLSPPTGHAAQELPALVGELPPRAAFEALLLHVLAKVDEGLHLAVFRWALEKQLPLHEYDSPFLLSFLTTNAAELPHLRAKHLHAKGMHAQACDAYAALAREEQADNCFTLADRKVFLQQALVCAEQPRWQSAATPTTSVAQLEDCLGMVQMQEVALAEISDLEARNLGDEGALASARQLVTAKILSSTELYNEVCVSAQLFETCIATRYLCGFHEDFPGVVKLYEKLVHRWEVEAEKQRDWELLRTVVCRICTEYGVKRGPCGLAQNPDEKMPVDVLFRSLCRAAERRRGDLFWPYAVLLDTPLPYDILLGLARQEREPTDRIVNRWVEDLEDLVSQGGGSEFRAFRKAVGVLRAAARGENPRVEALRARAELDAPRQPRLY